MATLIGTLPNQVPLNQYLGSMAFEDVVNYKFNSIIPVAALNIDCSLGSYFTKTIAGNSTFTVSSVPAGVAYSFILELTHTSGTVTWFSGVEWPSLGLAPLLTAGRTHVFVFITDDGGTRWRGSYNVDYAN